MNDPIAEFLTIIRNASRALLPEVKMAHSKMKESLARILKEQGYIADYAVTGDIKKQLALKLKYVGRKGVIVALRRMSKPGLRSYVRATNIPRVLSGMGTVIMSTPKGVMTGVEASKNNLGGEVVCYVW